MSFGTDVSALSVEQAKGERSGTSGHASRPALPAITGLRFFAAVIVVFHHFGQLALPAGPMRHIGEAGYVGVSFFFVLSGFVLVYVYQPGERILDVRAFVAARVARIYPLYLASLAIGAFFFFSALFGRNTLALASLKGLGALGLRLTLVQAWVHQLGVWNVPDWSLSCEWLFYLSFPWAMVFVAKPRPFRHLVLLGALLWAGPQLVWFGHHAAFPQWAGGEGAAPLTTLLRTHPLARLPEFLAGGVLGRMWMTNPKAFRPWLGWLGTSGCLLALGCSPSMPLLPLANGLLTPAFAMLIVSLCGSSSVLARFLSLRPITALGDASYGIYILHWPIWQIFTSARAAFGLAPKTEGVAFWLYLLAVILASLLAYVVIERPLRPRVQRWLLAFQSRRGESHSLGR